MTLIKISDILIFEDSDFIVLNKPSGLLSIPDRAGKEISLKKILQNAYGDIYTVHRLDKGTSGLIAFAKNENAHKFLFRQFEDRSVEKIYLGLTLGCPANKKDIIQLPILEHPGRPGIMVINKKGKESITEYEVLDDFGIYAWVQFQIHTGRTHQIRIHMKSIGHAIACDEVYGDGKPVFLSAFKPRFKLSKKEEEERPILDHLALHAYRLKFAGPSKNEFRFEVPIPKDMKATLQQLSKRKTASSKN